MTTEEKARAYNEALEVMRQWIAPCHTKEQLDTLKKSVFPELAESEDERIGNVIYCIVRDNKEVKRILEGNGVSVDNALAYLEKQKEKEKYDRMMPVYDNLDSFESALAKAWKAYNDSGARTVDGCEDDYIECAHAKGFREGYLFGLEKQKEQKHPNGCFTCDEYKKGYEEGRRNGFTAGYNKAMKEVEQKEQKPAEWSEEDERMLSRCIKSVECSKQFADSETYKAAKDVEMNWLKSLPKRFNLQPKQEWSDEDEEKYQCIRNILLTDMDKKVGSWKYSEILEWYEKRGIGRYTNFKPHWKPNEEQIKAIRLAKSFVVDDFDEHPTLSEILMELEEQLKKLM